MHIVTLDRLDSALSSVIDELNFWNFWTQKLSGIDVYLAPIGVAYGWQLYRGDGSINIPAVSLCKLTEFFIGEYASLRDILRHEYEHALAHCYPGLFHSKVFSKVFGSPHSSDQSFYYDPEIFVTNYAAKNAAEDFCETFMLYLKLKGKLPSRLCSPVIKCKWQFIKYLSSALKKGKSRR
jgi:hypothetical protein